METNTQNLTPEASPEKHELFYNVMPQDFGSHDLVMPESGPPVVTSSDAPARSPRKILLVIAAIVGVAIIGAASYFLYSRFIKAPVPSDDTPAVVQQPTENTKADDQTETTPPPYTTPPEWQKKFFGNETCLQLSTCGDDADPDHDGLSNLEEFNVTTDPNNFDSDSDGLADGDELHIFGSSPLKIRTKEDSKYTDADYAKGGYDTTTKQKFLPDKMTEIKNKIKQYGFHEPTLTTLAEFAAQTYGYGSSDSSSSGGLDNTPQGKLDRDQIRLTTIKKLGIALIKYKAAVKTFPNSTSFSDMVEKVKPYNPVATNPVDPINKDQFTYTYQMGANGQDFTMTYYSETQNQIIKYKAVDAQKAANQEQATLNDDQRTNDLDNLRTALLIYSSGHVAGTQDYVFPPVENYKTELVPKYLTSIPKDPKTGQDYPYSVSATFNTFTLKAVLEAPPAGTTGYICNQEECRNY